MSTETEAAAPAEALTVAPERPEDRWWPLADETLAALTPERPGMAELYAPLAVPPEPRWEPWPELAACRTLSAGEQDAQVSRWWDGLCERMYEGSRGPRNWLTGTAPDPGPRNRCSIWPRPDGPGPASQEQAAEAGAQGWTGAGREPDFSPPPTPGPPSKSGTVPPPVEDVPRPGSEPEASAAEVPMSGDRASDGPGHPNADADAEQFGAPDEPFWEDDEPRIVPPPETTEMTAVLPVPQEGEQ